MGKGKEAGAGRACAGGSPVVQEEKSVSRRWAAHAFDTGHVLLWLTLLWGSCLWDAFCAMCMGGCGSAERAFAVRESLYANRQSLCKRAALTKAGDSYANR